MDQTTNAHVLRTEDLEEAVALRLEGWPKPDLEVIGETRDKKPKVAFLFSVPAGASAAAAQAKFASGNCKHDVTAVFETMRSFKKRINRLPRVPGVVPSAAPPAVPVSPAVPAAPTRPVSNSPIS